MKKRYLLPLLLVPMLCFAAVRDAALDFNMENNRDIGINHKAFTGLKITGTVTTDGTTAYDLTGQTGDMIFKTRAQLGSTNTWAKRDIVIVNATGGVFSVTFTAGDWSTNITTRNLYWGDIRMSDLGNSLPSVKMSLFPSANQGNEFHVTPTGEIRDYSVVSQFVGVAVSGPIRPGSNITFSANADGSQDVNGSAGTTFTNFIGGTGGINISGGGRDGSNTISAAFPVTNLASTMSLNRQQIGILSDGASITGIVTEVDGLPLTWFFDGTGVTYAAGTVVTGFVAGTDNLLQENWVIARKSGISVVTNYPAGERAIMFRVLLLSASKTQANGPFQVQRYSKFMTDADDQSHLGHIGDRLRREPARWDNGVGLIVHTNVNGAADDDLFIGVEAGAAFQIHRHILPAVSTNGSAANYQVMNTTTGIITITNLNQITVDAGGGAVLDGNNSFFNIDVFRCVDSGVTNPAACEILINLSSGDYNSLAEAQSDSDGLRVTSVANALFPNVIMVAKITLRRQAAGGGTWTAVAVSTMGMVPGINGGGTSVAAQQQVFDDLTWRVHANDDSTKLMEFNVTDVSPATTRTLFVPDKSGTNALLGDIIWSNIPTVIAYEPFSLAYTNGTYEFAWFGPWDSVLTLSKVTSFCDGGTGTLEIVERTMSAGAWRTFGTNNTLSLTTTGQVDTTWSDASIAVGNLLGLRMVSGTCTNIGGNIKLTYSP